MNDNRFVNYHCHSMYSNVITPDVTITNEDRARRTHELGHVVSSHIEHGWTGNYFESVQVAKKYDLKPLLGVEAYFVKDRHESDKTNSHLILLAKNEAGRKEINKALSEANLTGYYYKARLDLELISQMNPKNVWCTTACLGGIWKYPDYEEILLQLRDIFRDSLFLEVQPHYTEEQIKLNQVILKLAKKYSIQIIAGMDSHMITSSQSDERDQYLASRGIVYPDETGWFLDYPSRNEAMQRFLEQGVLTEIEAEMALDNTLVFENVEEYDSPIFDLGKIKLPTIYPELTQEQKDRKLSDLIWSQWDKEKVNIPQEKHGLYMSEIQKELDIILETKMSDYFLLDYEIVKRGKELGGHITLTGRGSAPSFYMNKLIGLTTIDRINASVHLYPERFITKERILESGSLPDIDLNLGNPEVFALAQEEIMGEGHSYPMIAYVTLKSLGAWKMYSRVNNVDFDKANEISERLKQFEFDVTHAEEDDEVFVENYLDEDLLPVYEESRKYIGLVNSLTVHPCAYLLYSEEDISEEFGLIKIKTGKVEHICVNCDGYFAEKSHMLKNDLLKVNVVELIHRVYERIGVEPHTLPELINVCDGNKKVWSVYTKQAGIGINQVEQPGTISRVAKFAPKNISELSAFVAAIRPGFKSNYQMFENREPFEYGIESLDKLIQTREFPQSYMLYQEQAMRVMEFAGILMSKTYDIVKAIAKKRYKDIIKEKSTFLNGMTKRISEFEGKAQEWAQEIAGKTWQIIEDSSKYSFNASHSYAVAGDSLYGAYLKSHYPVQFYEVILGMMEEQGDKDRMALTKSEAENIYHIKFLPMKFRQDNRSIVSVDGKKEITSSLQEIKGFGGKTAEDLFEISNETYENFVMFLVDCDERGILSSKFETLIKIHYFEEFGCNGKLLKIYTEFKQGKNRYSAKHTDKTKAKRLDALLQLWNETPNKMLSVVEQIQAELEIFGQIKSTFNKPKILYVIDIDTKYSPKLLVYSLQNGYTDTIKVSKKLYQLNRVYDRVNPKGRTLIPGDFVYWKRIEKKNAWKKNPDATGEKDEFIQLEDQYDFWLEDFEILPQ